MLEHDGRASPAFISRHVGLPCRSTGCRELFARRGMQGDFAVLMAAAAERNAHELAEHALVFEAAVDQRGPFYATHAAGGRERWRRQRIRIGMNLP